MAVGKKKSKIQLWRYKEKAFFFMWTNWRLVTCTAQEIVFADIRVWIFYIYSELKWKRICAARDISSESLCIVLKNFEWKQFHEM